MRLLDLTPRLLVALSLGLLACQSDPEDGPPAAPEVEDPPADTWLTEVYKPVQEQAKKLSVQDFLAEYPLPAYVDAVSYDPLAAADLDAIRSYAGLSPEHDAILGKNGFVAVDKAPTTTFATAYLDLYDADMPVLITADSMLYALHKSFDSMLIDFERAVLVPEVARMLELTHTTLAQQLPKLPEALAQTGKDLDLYLAVGRTLLSGAAVAPVSGDPDVADRVQRILDAAEALQPLDLELFGVSAPYDFSQMEPRGHYEEEQDLRNYFKAMIWLGRTDLAMVTFDETQQPRFNRRGLDAAFVLNHLMSTSGADAHWKRVDKTLTLLIGERDSMNFVDMTNFMDEIGAHSPEELAAKDDKSLYAALIAGPYGLQRIMSQIMYTNPTDPPLVLPRVYHMMGQRFTVDSHVFNNVTYDRVQDLRTGEKVRRMLPSELDVQFALGNNAAGHHLEPELEQHGYQGVLHELRFLIDSHPQEFWDSNFYNGWLAAIRALNDTTEFANLPEAMRTAAWADKGLNTQAASWAELRHDTLLYVKQSYSGGIACEYPDAYVEPVPAFYARLAHLGEIGTELADELAGDGFEVTLAKDFFAHLQSVSGTLEGIAQKELDGQALSAEEFTFLKGTIEKEIIGCGEEHYDGWYGRLFYNPAKLVEFEPTIADVHTAPTDAAGNEVGWVLHAATGKPMLLVFTMEDCSGTRAYIGPVSSFHSVLTEDFDRQTDSAWTETLAKGDQPRPAWTASFIP